jgi:hypothetical protein
VPEPARLRGPSVSFGSISIEYSLPAYLETTPPSLKEFGLFPAGERSSWYKVGEVQGKREGVVNLDVEGIPAGDYDLGLQLLSCRIATRRALIDPEESLSRASIEPEWSLNRT